MDLCEGPTSALVTWFDARRTFNGVVAARTLLGASGPRKV